MAGPSFLLNGCTCSGKTTLARTMQGFAQYQLLHVGLDAFLTWQGPARWKQFADHDQVWDRMLDGFHALIPALIDAGVAVVIDHVLQEKRWLPLLARTLASRNVYFVGVLCSADTAQARVLARGSDDRDTIPFQMARVHAHGRYDLTVETDRETAETLAKRILEAPTRGPPSALATLAAAADPGAGVS